MVLSSEDYRREARRLYDIAGSLPFGDVRNGFLELARQYDALAHHAEAMEGRTTTALRDGMAPIGPISLVPER